MDTGHTIVSDRPTTLAFVQVQEGHATYRFYDENSAGSMLNFSDFPVLSNEVSTLYFGGISLACEPGADAYATLLQNEGKTRAIMLDPNIRPDFIKDADRFRARLGRMMDGADIIKVSDEDLTWLMPGPEPLHDKARSLLETGPTLVILTQGSAGSTGFLRDAEAVYVGSRKVEVVDTVGAGDTFNAGVLSYLARHDLLHKDRLCLLTPKAMGAALAFGAKVAAVTVSRVGANPPWADELQ